MSGRVLSPEHRAVLAGLAEDTGGFRVNKDAATRIAEACAAALAACEEPQPITLRQTRGPDGESVLVRAPVDVLAVMARACRHFDAHGYWGGEKMPAALAAVTELVEAARFAAEALAVYGDAAETERQLRAALARIGGAS